MPRLKGGAPPPPAFPRVESPAVKTAVTSTPAAETGTTAAVVGGNGLSQTALRALAMDVRAEASSPPNAGAEAATLGARVMDMVRSDRGRRVLAAVSAGISLLGGGLQAAHADTIFIEASNDVTIAQAARELATEVGEDFTLVRNSNDALRAAFKLANNGKADMRHLIVSTGGAGIDVSKLREMKEEFPLAFAQVEHVHVIGEDVSHDPLQGAGAELFPNAASIISFQMGPDSSPSSDWLLKQTTAEARKLTPTLTPAQAMIEAKALAAAGIAAGANIRVSVGTQSTFALANAPADATSVTVDVNTVLNAHSPLELNSGVGENQPNQEDDVLAVQQRLKDLGFRIQVDGAYGGETRRILKTFTAMVKGHEYVKQSDAVGLVPGSELHRVIEAEQCPTWAEMPSEGVGFKNADWDKHDFGSSVLSAVIQRTGQRYEDAWRTPNPNASVIHTNDASRRSGGDTGDHETHEAGLDLDVRLPRTDGLSGTQVRYSDYDRPAARAMIKAFIADPQVERVLIGDKTLLQEFKGSSDANARKVQDGGRAHRDHLHIDIAPLNVAGGAV